MLSRPVPAAAISCAVAWLGLLASAGPAGRQATAALAPRIVTLKGKELSLDAALAQVQKQTGIVVRDRRGRKGTVPLSLAFERTTFWQAVDALAGKAGAGVSPFQPDGSVALVAPPARPLPISYSGLFRGALKRLALTYDLETGTHAGTVHLEVAWEPWFRPLLLEVDSYTARYGPDGKGRALEATRQGPGQIDVHDRPAIEVELALPAPDRSAPALASLEATLSVIGPTKMLAVRFDRLAEAARVGKPRVQTPEEGISVTLSRLAVVDTDRWEVEMSLAYPPGGPRFESFQSWLVNNRLYLEKGQGKARQRLLPRPADERIVRLTATQAIVQYYFVEDARSPRLGSPGDWELVYETPGRMVETQARFTFRDLPLP